MSKVQDLARFRQINRAQEIRNAAKKQGFEVPDRFPRAGDLVHVLLKQEHDIGGAAVLRAVLVTNVDFNGRIFGWLFNDPANPMMVAGRDGRPVPAPPMLDVAGIPYDPTGEKANHWSYMKGAIGPGDLPPVREPELGEDDLADEGSEAESDDAPEPSPAA